MASSYNSNTLIVPINKTGKFIVNVALPINEKDMTHVSCYNRAVSVTFLGAITKPYYVYFWDTQVKYGFVTGTAKIWASTGVINVLWDQKQPNDLQPAYQLFVHNGK
jgi:hypothetical protein